MRRIPDWLIYGSIVLLVYTNASRASHEDLPQPPPPLELGDLLPRENPRDPSVIVDIQEKPSSGVGTAFSIDDKGTWLTARHVVDGCSKVGLNLGKFRSIEIKSEVLENSDTAILRADWNRKPIPSDLETQRQIGEYGFFFGFPQGRPGEVIGSLLGRQKMIVQGRYNTQEAILAWTEIGRTRGLKGSLGGLSGAPVLDKDGEVIGIVAAENPRRGRIYTVAPKNLKNIISPNLNLPSEPIDAATYGTFADSYRRDRRIAQVVCLVK